MESKGKKGNRFHSCSGWCYLCVSHQAGADGFLCGGSEGFSVSRHSSHPPHISITFFSVSVGGGGDQPDCLRCIPPTTKKIHQTNKDVATEETDANIICFQDCK